MQQSFLGDRIMEDAFDCFEKLARKRKVEDAAVQKKKRCMGTGFILE